MCSGKVINDLFYAFFRRRCANPGTRTGTKTLGDFHTQLNFFACTILRQCLRVSIGDDKFNSVQSLFDHVIDRVSAGPADSENRDTWFQFVLFWNIEIKCHFRVRLIDARSLGCSWYNCM